MAPTGLSHLRVGFSWRLPQSVQGPNKRLVPCSPPPPPPPPLQHPPPPPVSSRCVSLAKHFVRVDGMDCLCFPPRPPPLPRFLVCSLCSPTNPALILPPGLAFLSSTSPHPPPPPPPPSLLSLPSTFPRLNGRWFGNPPFRTKGFFFRSFNGPAQTWVIFPLSRLVSIDLSL